MFDVDSLQIMVLLVIAHIYVSFRRILVLTIIESNFFNYFGVLLDSFMFQDSYYFLNKLHWIFKILNRMNEKTKQS